MADLKISQLPAASALVGGEVVPIVQSGTTKQAAFNGVIQTFFATTFQLVTTALTNFLAVATTGLLTRTAANTYTTRTITGTGAQIDVASGDGVAGNPTISLNAAVTAGITQSQIYALASLHGTLGGLV